MHIDPYNFADKLAAWMAAAVPIEYAGVPRALWLGQAAEVEGSIADPYSVLSVYPGADLPWVAVPAASIQVKTVGEDAAAWARAVALFNTLFEADGRPRRNLTLTGYRVLGFLTPRAPGQIGRDDRRRAEVVFNFDALYHAA